MANKRKILEDNCEEELEKKKEELEKYVEDHVNKMTVILANIEDVEKRLTLEKLEICKNDEKIERLKEINKELHVKSKKSMSMLSKLREEKSELKKYRDTKVFHIKTEIESLQSKSKKRKKMKDKAEIDSKEKENGPKP